MDAYHAPATTAEAATENANARARAGARSRLIRWGIVLAAAIAVLLVPVPHGITPASWRLLAIFVALGAQIVRRFHPAQPFVLHRPADAPFGRSFPFDHSRL